MLCEQKQTQNTKEIFKEFICLKTKQNIKMSDEEHSDVSEFYYPEKQETVERKASW